MRYKTAHKSIPLPQISSSVPLIASTGDEDEEIRLLTEQLQFELGNLSGTHSVLESDMQRLASMLAPFMTPAGRLNLPDASNGGLDPKILLFKQGLDFRISEYNEDCKRLESVQDRLQRKLEEAAGSYERTFMGASGLADARIIRRLEEQQRVIQIQQQELDQTRFERDVVADEAKRLRQMFIRTGPTRGQQRMPAVEPFQAGIGSLHTATAARFAPMAGPSATAHTQEMATKPVSVATPPVARNAPHPVAAAPAAPEEQGWLDWWGANPQAGPAVTNHPPTARRDFL